MDLRSYIRFLRGSWEWVAVFTLLGIIVAMLSSLSVTPKFVATSELFLTTPGYSSTGALSTNNSSPYQADAFSQQRARSYVQLASRVDLAHRVVEKLGLSMRPEELAGATSASVEPDTVLIQVSVKSSSAAEAKVLADAVAAELANDIRKLETPSGTFIPVVDPVVTQPAEIPTKPRDPDIAVYLLLGVSGGLLVGVTVAPWLKPRRTVERQEVEKFTGRPILGAIRSDPVHSSGLLEEEWRVIQRNVASEIRGARHRVLAVTSANDAGQSSATAAGLASAFARAGSRVVLVAMEPKAHNRAISRERPPIGLAEVIVGESQLDDALQSTDTDNLCYLAAPSPENVTPLLQSRKFRQVVGQLRELFDLVIVDAPEFLRQAESTLLSEVVDSVILVMAESNIDRRDLFAAVRRIDNCHARLSGSIWKSGRRGSTTSTPAHTFATSSRGLDQ